MSDLPSYEKLGVFYLGRVHDIEAGETTDQPLLYESKDLTTHAVCVGMTGSGKTGLCIGLLEEAAIDRIPAIAIDPKGDLGNLLLTFPELRPEDFQPWVDSSEAARKGMSLDDYAANRAELWRNGLKQWDQDGARIKRLRDTVDMAIYTPGSESGLPLSILQSFNAPPAAVRDDKDLMRERVMAVVSGLLALVGIKADPIQSREHILLSNIIDTAWRAGRNLDLARMIHELQNPPFQKVGVMDLESFFPAKDRFELAMALNSLLAAPGFAAWMKGDPLDVGKLLYTEDGKPRVSILSIAHLDDAERMFFVTLLLNEVISWMRSQPGTSSLRALLYMDEVFGYLPPTANPPSKLPMLTLLKQARAYGLGLVLATQNPVDLDYKGLSNTGTWFLGRLQTERDKQRVLEGLEGASVAAGSKFNRSEMDRILAGLGSRVFLMNNVHEDTPVLFHTRWAMSYLRGPLTRDQIRQLTPQAKRDETGTATAATMAPAPVSTTPATDASPAHANVPPPLPPEINCVYYPLDRALVEDKDRIEYRAAVIGIGKLHYARVSANIDEWHDVALLAPVHTDNTHDPWEDAQPISNPSLTLHKRAPRSGSYAELPSAAAQEDAHRRWERGFVDHVYRNNDKVVFQCRELKQYSKLGVDERAFRMRLADEARERRDAEVEKLRDRYTPKLATLQERIRKAGQKVEKEKAQYTQSGWQTAISIGTTILGAVFGRKTKSGTVSGAGTAANRAGRTARERGDIARAEADLKSLQKQLADLDQEFQDALKDTEVLADVSELELREITIRPRKSDVVVRTHALCWVPYRVSPEGVTEPAFTL